MSQNGAEQTIESTPSYVADGKRFVAFPAPSLAAPQRVPAHVPLEKVGARIVSPLKDKEDKAVVDLALGRLVDSYGGGSSITNLFLQKTEAGQGMHLVHVWFGPNLKVYNHSHPTSGDCLYYVVAGQVIQGSKTLGPGSVLFVPKGKSYSVTVGPAGVEFLEFRVGDLDPEQPPESINERSLANVEKLIANNEHHKASWEQPGHIGEVAFLQREYEQAQQA